MARKKAADGPNKAKLIRDYMAENTGAGPKDVAEALNASHNLGISAQYVSTVKAMDKKGGKKKKAAGRKGRPPAAASAAPAAVANGDLLSSLVQAKKLADAMGGVAQAKLALDALAKLGL